MIDTSSPKKLYEEVEAAQRFARAHVDATSEISSMLLGSYFSKDRVPTEPTPENHPFEYAAQTLPKIVFNNPRVKAYSPYPQADGTARGLQHALNRWSKQTSARNVLKRIATGFLVNYGVGLVQMQPEKARMPGSSGLVSLRPVIKRLPTHRFFADHRAVDLSEARFQGHLWSATKDDLIEEARRDKNGGWDLDALESLPVDVEMGKYYLESEKKDGPERKELLFYEVWVPNEQLEKLPGNPGEYHGTIYTLAVTGGGKEAKYIRKPRAFFGPSIGPYHVFGAYWFGDNLYPLSALAATFDQVKEHNAHSASAARSAANYKEGVAYDAANESAGTQLLSFRHGEVFPIKGLAGGITQPVKIGGVGPEIYQYLTLLQERVYRAMGLDEAGRGQVSASATATAIAEATAATSSRVEYMAREFADATNRMFWSVGWYMWHSHFFRSALGEDGQRDFSAGAEFIGGLAPGEEDLYDELSIDIVTRSIGHTSDAIIQKRAQDRMGVLTGIAPIIPQTPYINWADALEDYGEETNDQGLGRYIDMQMAMQMPQEVPGKTTPNVQTINIPHASSGTIGAPGLRGNQRGALQSSARNIV